MKLLIVDDEPDVLNTALKRMKKRDIDATGARNSAEVIALVEKYDFDVAVVDVKLPGREDGIQILKEIKSRRPATEVIMLTGHALMDVANAGMENGAFDYMMKPADPTALLRIIKDACKKKNARQEPEIRFDHAILEN